MLPFAAFYDRNLKCLAFSRNYFEPWCAVDALEIGTVLRKFNPWEQNPERFLRLASPAMTSSVSSRRVAEKDKERKPTSGLEPLTSPLYELVNVPLPLFLIAQKSV